MNLSAIWEIIAGMHSYHPRLQQQPVYCHMWSYLHVYFHNIYRSHRWTKVDTYCDHYNFWNPHLEKDKSALENVQKFACRIALAHWDDSYDDILDLLNLQSLLERRIHARVGMLYRIVYKLSFFPEGTFKLRGNSIPNRSSHQLELSVPFAHTNCYYYSFVPHTISLWNSLSTNIISSSSSLCISYLSRCLDRLDSTISTGMIRISTFSEYLMDILLEISNALYTMSNMTTHFVVYGWLTSGNFHL